MMILVGSGILLMAGAVLWIAHVFHRGLRLSWVAATSTTGIVWLLVCLWPPLSPSSVSLPIWKAGSPYMPPASFSATGVGWPFALATLAVLMAGLLTAPAKGDFRDSGQQAICLTAAGISLLAVTAANAPTLVVLWAALDTTEIYFMIRPGGESKPGSAAATVVMIKLAAIGLALLGQLVDVSAYQQLSVVAAVVLRMSAVPLTFPKSASAGPDGNVGMTLQLCSISASLAVLARLQPTSSPYAATFTMLLGSLGAALLLAWSWLRGSGSAKGGSYWVLGLAALAVVVSTRGNAAGVAGWGATLLLTSGLLFFPGSWNRWTRPATVICGWAVAALPFSPTAAAWMAYAAADLPVMLAQVLIQGLLLAGFLSFAMRPSEGEPAGMLPVWRAVHTAGIASIPISLALIGAWGWQGARQIGLLPAAIAVGLLGAGLAWARRRWGFWPPLVQPPHRASRRQGSGIRLWLGALDGQVHGLTRGITDVLEGEAGIMWSMLVLILLVSLMAGLR